MTQNPALPADPDGTDPLRRVFWRDEILQILYWLRGEGLGENVTPRDLLAFLDLEMEPIRTCLEQMAAEGYVTAVEGKVSCFRLTDFGVREGGRHFAAEFSDLTHTGHGECNDPDCVCHTLGPEACRSEPPTAKV